MSGWGGARKGSGRPAGWRKENPQQRPVRHVRAFDDEWEIIQLFAQAVKGGKKDICENFVKTLE